MIAARRNELKAVKRKRANNLKNIDFAREVGYNTIMSESLYRKYRPKTFDDVFGQEHITTTLKNQIKLGRVGHAYLFTGSRGTGKTTCAKIFARAVNCAKPKDGSPCYKCDACKALDSSNNMDIVEMDAASNNGVDDARKICETVRYLPSGGRKSVYIIDEVHMLTGGAFNALLKTIEEPPEHVVFILATTDPQKLPATILSRCMRFDFRLVPSELIAEHICSIFDKEKKKYERDAVDLIARLGEGSVRDAYSIADMCLNYSDVLTLADVEALTGATDVGDVLKLLSAMADGDIAKSFTLIDEGARAGKNMQLIASQLASTARDATLYKLMQDGMKSNAVIVTPERLGELAEVAAKADVDFFTGVMREFSSAVSLMKYSLSPRVNLETAVLEAIALKTNSVEARLSRIESAIKSGASVSAMQSVAVPLPKVEPVVRGVGGADTGEGALPNADGVIDGDTLKGLIITKLRRRGHTDIINAIMRGCDIQVGDEIVLTANEDNYLFLCDREVSGSILAAAVEAGVKKPIKVIKIGTREIDGAIDTMKSLFGDRAVTVKFKSDKKTFN